MAVLSLNTLTEHKNMPINEDVVWESPILNTPTISSLDKALIEQESGGNWDVGTRSDSKATGGYQITPPYLADGNKFAGTNFKLSEMSDPEKAQVIKDAYQEHYATQFQSDNGRAPTNHELAMIHHGGPYGYKNPDVKDSLGVSNRDYADQVVSRMRKIDLVKEDVAWDNPNAKKNIVNEDIIWDNLPKAKDSVNDRASDYLDGAKKYLSQAGDYASGVVRGAEKAITSGLDKVTGSLGNAVSEAGQSVSEGFPTPIPYKARDIRQDIQYVQSALQGKKGYDTPLVAAGKVVQNIPAYIDTTEKQGAQYLSGLLYSAVDNAGQNDPEWLKRSVSSAAYALSQHQVAFPAKEIPINAEKGGVSEAIKNVGPYIPSIGVGIINPIAGATLAGVQTAGEIYQNDINSGVSNDMAVKHASISGAAQTALFSMPVIKVLGPLMAPELTMIQRAIGGAITGETFAKFSQALQIGIDKGTVSPDMTFGQAWNQWTKEGNGTGAVIGGALGAVAHPFVYRKTTTEPYYRNTYENPQIAEQGTPAQRQPSIQGELSPSSGVEQPRANNGGVQSEYGTVVNQPSARQDMVDLVNEKLSERGMPPATREQLSPIIEKIARQAQPYTPAQLPEATQNIAEQQEPVTTPVNPPETVNKPAEKQPEVSVNSPELVNKSLPELEALYTEKKSEEDNGDLSVFGSQARLDEYNKAHRMWNSQDAAKEKKGADLVHEIESGLTEDQRNKLYGVGDTYSSDDIKSLIDASGKLDFSSPEALGESLKYAVTKIGKPDSIEKMDSTQREAYYQLKIAGDEVQKRGWDSSIVSKHAIEGAASRITDPQDAEFMLQQFIRPSKNQESQHASIAPEDIQWDEVTPGQKLAPNPKQTAFDSRKAGQTTTHSDQIIYPTKGGKDQTPYWAVQRVENKGTDKTFGDTLHLTIEEAKQQAERNSIEKTQNDKRKAERDAITTKKEEEDAARSDIDGFGDNVAPMMRGKIVDTLSKLSSTEFGILSRKELVRKLVERGDKPNTREEPKIKPLSRTAFNRADNREQRAHEEKMKAAGNKTVYSVGDYDLGRTAHDYAVHLIELKNKQSTEKPVSLPEEKPKPQEQEKPVLAPVEDQATEKPADISTKIQNKLKEDVARKIIEGDSDDSGIQALRNSAPNHMPNYQPLYSKIGMPQRPASGRIEIGNRTVKITEEDKPTRIESIRQQIEDMIGREMYHGKIKGRMGGFFRGQNAEVRIGKYNDIETMGHEVAHFISEYGDRGRFVKALYNRYADELKQLSYTDIEGKQAKEGFAEYMRLWFTQYKEAESRAPEFTKAFEHFLSGKENKKFAGQMRRLQDDMHRWFYQGDMARLEAVTGGNQYTTKERVTAWVAQRPLSLMRQHFIDNLHAAKVMEREIHGDIRDANLSAYKQLQLINGVEGTIQESMLHGAPYFAANGDIMFKGPSQESIWKESLGKGIRGMREQEIYFASRRMAETKMQGRENLADAGMIKAGLDLAVNRPSLKDAFRDYQEHNDLMRAFYVDCGYVEQATADKWGKVNRNYVPLNREVEGIGTSFAGSGSGNLKRLKGGTQNLKHIYDNIMLSEAQHIKAALRCRAIRSLYMDALNSKEGGKFMAPLGPDSKLVRSTIDAQAKVIAKAMMEFGLTLSSDGMIVSGNPTADQITEVSDIIQVLEDNPEMMQFWTFGHKPKTVETQVDSFINPKTGKRQWVEIKSELVADMIDNLAGARIPDGALGTIIKGLIFVKQMQTLTITAAWQFAGPNIVRDMQEAAIRSGGTFRPIIDNIYGIESMLHDLVKREGWYHEMKAQGGGWSGRVRSIMTDTWQLSEGPMAPKVRSEYHPVSVAQKVVDALMSIADFAEMSTRVGFYIRLRKVGISAREAAWQAREITVDFRKHGSYAPLHLLIKTVPFLGAYIQAQDRDIRAIAEDNGTISAKNILKLNKAKVSIYLTGGAMIAAGIALALLNGEDDRYKELTPDQKTRFFHIFAGDKHYTIPKAHGFFTMMMNAAESLVDTIKGQSGEDAGKYVSFALAYELGAEMMPGALSPLLSVARNKTFTNAPIISDRVKDLPSEYQFTDRTSVMYVNIGRELKISPDVAQYMVKGYVGYVADYLNEVSDAVLWNKEQWGERPFSKDLGEMVMKQFIPKSIPYRTKYTDEYYELKKQAAEQEGALKYLQNTSVISNPGRLDKLTKSEQAMGLASANNGFTMVDHALSNQDMAIASIKYDPKLSKKEKEKQIDEYYKQKNDLLKETYKSIKDALK